MGFKAIINEYETKVFFNDIDISRHVMANMEIVNKGMMSTVSGNRTQLFTLRIEVDLDELNGMKMANAHVEA